MKYIDIRPEIQSGDILLWSDGRGLLLNVIKLATHSPYTHCGIAWVIGSRVFVIEADPKQGVRIFPLSKALPFYILKRNNVAWTPEMEAYAVEKFGEPYSYLEAIRGFLNKTKHDTNWECAELVQEIVAHDDMCIMSIAPTPAKIAEYCTRTYKAEAIKVE